MQTIRRTVRLHRKQRDFRLSDALYRGFVGGRSSGKSWVGAYDLLRRAKRGRTYLVGSPTGAMLSDTTFPTFIKIAKDLGCWSARGVKLTPYPNVLLTTGATIRFRTMEDPERARGPNLSGVWLDEASLMKREAYLVSIASLREEGEQGWLSATFTPKGVAHWTYDVFGKKRGNTAIFHAETWENPFNPPEFQATLEGQYSGGFADQELRGLFIDSNEAGQLIPTAWIRAAMERWTPAPPHGEPLDAVGVDVARGGAAQTVLARRHGYWIAPMERHAGVTTANGPQVVALIVAAVKGQPRAAIMLDSIGVGTSVLDFCRENRLNVYAINNSAKTPQLDRTRTFRFANVRAFAYWSLRELLDPERPFAERLLLPPDEELLEDLAAPRWEVGIQGIKIEAKDEIAKRLGRSPDCADAVANAILLPGVGV